MDDAALKTLKEQLNLAEESLSYTALLIIASVLSYYTVDLQAQQLRDTIAGKSSDPPDLFGLQLSATLLSLYAAAYFYQVSEQTAAKPQQNEILEEINEINLLSNGMVLASSGLRFYTLLLSLSPNLANNPAEEEAAQETDIVQGLF